MFYIKSSSASHFIMLILLNVYLSKIIKQYFKGLISELYADTFVSFMHR